MAKTRKELRNELKTKYVSIISESLTSRGDEVLQVKDHEIAVPVVDTEGNEDFIKITIAIPTGSNKGTEPYDGYEMAEEYKMKQKEKAEKAVERQAAKEKKIERDKRYREKKAEQQAKRDIE